MKKLLIETLILAGAVLLFLNSFNSDPTLNQKIGMGTGAIVFIIQVLVFFELIMKARKPKKKKPSLESSVEEAAKAIEGLKEATEEFKKALK